MEEKDLSKRRVCKEKLSKQIIGCHLGIKRMLKVMNFEAFLKTSKILKLNFGMASCSPKEVNDKENRQ